MFDTEDDDSYPTTFNYLSTTSGYPSAFGNVGGDLSTTDGYPPASGSHLVSMAGPIQPAGGVDATLGTSAAPTMMSPAPCITIGVAAGDGDLMPPRFNGDRRTDAEDWLQDFLDYIAIRRIPQADAALLLRTRLTGAARTWLEGVPTGVDFDETIKRFRKRFGASDQSKPELMTEFWNRRQAPDEPAGSYIEEKARLARRMRIDSQPFVLQGIIQGLRADIKRDVMLQRPTTLEALVEAAAIGEASAKANASQTRMDEIAVTTQLTEMRAMMAAMQAMIATQQRPPAKASAIETSAPQQTPPPTTTITTTATTITTTALSPPGVSAPIVTPTNTVDGSRMTIQLVMPDPIATQHIGSRRDGGGPPRRGRGRGWRGPWSNRPAPRPTGTQQLTAAAPVFHPTANTTTTNNYTSLPCHQCGRNHADGDCRATYVFCYACGNPGHFARCCRSQPQPPNLQ